ncbi:DUF2325 domain-containing protein [Roseomonas elaeocarpi]|uniref:DUF2325 domain-containing protein n=1 Tax=Roseomonas elaeocarpi TaxID=907779 RepID=A0ABV6JMQ7_9PROT
MENWRAGSTQRLLEGRQAATPLPIRAQDAYHFAHRRRKLWELSDQFHCSIIGTCLSAAELRKLLCKLNPAHARETDHVLHGAAVGLAERHDTAGKMLHKALDARHAAATNRFARARTLEDVRSLWMEALAVGDIPGPYWAVMTHPDTSSELQREAFGEVHMLSHLVGAANRADIRRLAQLEVENAALLDKVAKQQFRLKNMATERDATIRELSQRLQEHARPAASNAAPLSDLETHASLENMRRRLGSEVEHRVTLQRRLDEMRACLEAEQRRSAEARGQVDVLQTEVAALEATLSPEETGGTRIDLDLHGMTLLYVGGRPSQASRLRIIAEATGAALLLHDGGLENAEAQLDGLASRADAVLFPVDCVSHDAALTVKRHCRRVGKPFIPLRSTGSTAFLAALHSLATHPERRA